MKRTLSSDFCAVLLRAVLSLCIALGTVTGLASAYRLPFREWETVELIVGCAVFCSILSAMWERLPKKAGIALIGLIAAGLGGVLWFGRNELADSLRCAAGLINPIVESYYDVGLPNLKDVEHGTADATAALELLGVLYALSAVWAASRDRSGFRVNLLALLMTPAVILQMIIMDYAPRPWCVALTVCGCLGLFLGWRAKESGRFGTALLLLLPAALLASSALLFSPEEYRVPAWRDAAVKGIVRLTQSLSGENRSNGVSRTVKLLEAGLGSESSNEVRLDDVGPIRQTGVPVMEAFSDEDTRGYLFCAAYGVYDGSSWLPVKDSAYRFMRLTTNDWLTDGYGENTIWIRLNRQSSVLYLPYGFLMVPAGAYNLYDNLFLNGDGLREYMVAVGSGNTGFGLSPSYRSLAETYYTEVPAETAEALSEIVAELRTRTASMTVDEIAETVADYVSSSASYDMNTPKMPRNRDFVSWFLLESDTGYCVHFASAAAILLRCLGIPSRYVIGYAAYLTGGEWVEITEDSAHAWAEYYREGEGWVGLEATASYELNPPPPREKPDVEVVFVPEEEMESAAEPEAAEEAAEDGLHADEEDAPAPAPAAGGEKRSVDPVRLAAVGVPALLVLWQILVRLIRLLYRNSGSAETRAVRLYRCAERMAKLGGGDVPDALRIPAERARFGCAENGRNAVTAEELAEMRRMTDLMKRELYRKKNVPGRLWLFLRYAL